MKKIALFTDCHGLLEPTEAILEDIRNRQNYRKRSLGDSIGLGPNPKEILSLFQEYQVQSLAGNYEEHINLGLEPFSSYLTNDRIENVLWTKSRLSKNEIEYIATLPHFKELTLGGQKIALVHFANDVRFDFYENSSIFYYPDKVSKNKDSYKQFFYTNSKEQLLEIASLLGLSKQYFQNNTANEIYQMLKIWIQNRQTMLKKNQGYASYLQDPLFYTDGLLKQAMEYDAVWRTYSFQSSGFISYNDVLSYKSSGYGIPTYGGRRACSLHYFRRARKRFYNGGKLCSL